MKPRSRRTYHINEHIQWALPLLDELGRIVLLPLLLIVSQISGECLLAPGAVDGVGDWRKGGYRLVLARVTEELFPGRLVQFLFEHRPDGKAHISMRHTYQSQGTVTAHTVTSDANPACIQLRESSKDSLGQLLRHVAVHVVSVVVRRLGSIDVETGAGTKIPRIILSGNVQSP